LERPRPVLGPTARFPSRESRPLAEAAVEIRNVVKRYAAHVAVRELTLAVPRGIVYGLLGPNGAGKTTTLRMILNIIAPDAGTIRVLGAPVGERGVADRLGYLPEERGLYPRMRVRRLLRFLAELKGLPGREGDRRADAWLEQLGLRSNGADWGAARVEELSRGMQQKVQFIGALLHDPELVILDEPFSGLDPVNAQTLKDTVLDLRRRGRTVIFSTHVMDSAERMCDAICIVARGEKALEGDLATVKATHGGRHVALALDEAMGIGVAAVLGDRSLVTRIDESNRFFEIEMAPGADPSTLLGRLVAAGARIQRFERIEPSLHQIFLRHVGATGVEAGITGHG
jgi:ABC-2 type transport system ATP-binding protein